MHTSHSNSYKKWLNLQQLIKKTYFQNWLCNQTVELVKKTSRTVMNPDQTSTTHSQYSHSVKRGGKGINIELCNFPMANQSSSNLEPSPSSGTFIMALCSTLMSLQLLKVWAIRGPHSCRIMAPTKKVRMKPICRTALENYPCRKLQRVVLCKTNNIQMHHSQPTRFLKNVIVI